MRQVLLDQWRDANQPLDTLYIDGIRNMKLLLSLSPEICLHINCQEILVNTTFLLIFPDDNVMPRE
jgi:hypothetical protein